jgi:hypothetical protein
LIQARPDQTLVDAGLLHVTQIPECGESANLTFTEQALERFLFVLAGG